MFNLFGGGRDWNVLAILFERPDQYRVNANRVKGAEASKGKDGARFHAQCILWAVFDQKRKLVESGLGKAKDNLDKDSLARLKKEFADNSTVASILGSLESGEHLRANKPLSWDGYPTANV